MLDTTTNPTTQRDVLQQDIQLLQQIQSLLLTEQQHLERGEAWALPELTESKQNLTAEMDRRYAQRGPQLRELGLPSTMVGMREWMYRKQSTSLKADFERHWNQFLTLINEIKQLNQMNGRLIEMHLQQIESRLKNLSKASAADQVYGADGLTGLSQNSRARTTA